MEDDYVKKAYWSGPPIRVTMGVESTIEIAGRNIIERLEAAADKEKKRIEYEIEITQERLKIVNELRVNFNKVVAHVNHDDGEWA